MPPALRRDVYLAAAIVVWALLAVAAFAPSGSSSRAMIRFVGDWETGDSSQWNWTQCAGLETTQERGSVHVVRRPVGQGKFAARFDLPASDRNNACEVLRRRTIELGSDDWYGFEIRLPSRWREPSRAGWGLMIAQLNYQGIWGPPVGVVARTRTVDLVLQSGLCNDVTTPHPGCTYSSGPGGNVPKMVLIRRPVGRAQWHQIVIHVRWAADAGGVIEAWHRRRGQRRWVRTVQRAGLPTVQWSASRAPTYQGTVDKIGGYRGPAPFAVSVWHDAFVVGSSFAAVAAQLR